MAHTPGPWTIEYETEDGEPYDDGVRIDSLEGPVAFNVIDCSAHLIAAAPELLAVAKMAFDYAQDTKGRFIDHWDGEDAESYDKLCDACDAAIAKAEGRE
jgi:hypothetical protein